MFARQAGGMRPFIERLRRDKTLMLTLYRAYNGLARGGQRVDAVELLCGLLGRERGDAWLRTQLRAIAGNDCHACGRALSAETGAVLQRHEDAAERGAKLRPTTTSCVAAARGG